MSVCYVMLQSVMLYSISLYCIEVCQIILHRPKAGRVSLSRTRAMRVAAGSASAELGARLRRHEKAASWRIIGVQGCGCDGSIT